jgi:hypothetical protein
MTRVLNRRRASVAVLAVIGVVAPAIIAAAPPPPADSFAALSGVLRPRQPVMVTDADGETHRGTLVAISSADITIQSRVLFRRREHTFREENVRRVHLVDSDWNGALAGAGIGVVVTAIGVNECDSLDCLWVVLPPAAGALTGALIDRSLNRLVFRSGPAKVGDSVAAWPGADGANGERRSLVVSGLSAARTPPRVTVVPILGGDRMGAMVRLRLAGL